MIYSIIGWFIEEVVFSLWWSPAKLVNRGFLNGPYCPIYGVGAVLITYFLMPFNGSFALIFILSAVLASLLELVVGLLLDFWFHHKWWDYYNYPMNLNGYICMKSAVMWGLSGLILVYVLQPAVGGLINIIPQNIGSVILAILSITMLADLAITLLALKGVAKKYRLLNQIGKQINEWSDSIGQNIYDHAHEAVRFKDESYKNIEKLKHDYELATDKKVFGYNRIMKAFPNLVHKIENNQSDSKKAEK